jgi:hypothetical protein
METQFTIHSHADDDAKLSQLHRTLLTPMRLGTIALMSAHL